MNFNTCGWCLNFSWTPQLLKVGENSVETSEDETEILEWINFSTNNAQNRSNNSSSTTCVLQLLQKDDEPCTINILKSKTNFNQSAKFSKIKIVSKARRIEISSRLQGYLGTETGQRVVEDFYLVEINNLQAKDLILKFVSFSNKDHIELTSLELCVEESRANGKQTLLGSQKSAAQVDLSAVQTLLNEMDQPMSENAIKFMNQLSLIKPSQPTAHSSQVDLASMMDMLASINPNLTSQSSTSDVEPQPTNQNSAAETANLEVKVAEIVDAKLERLEAKMMQKVDKSVSAMEGRLMCKLDKLLTALDGGQDESIDKL